MTNRQFLWGLSHGIIALAIAGIFWFGWGFGPHLGEDGWVLPLGFTVITYGTSGAIVMLALRLRRRAEFKRSELGLADERLRAESHKIFVGFRRTVIAQAILVSLGVLFWLHQGRQDLLAAWIALIVSLHFIPLGRIFHVGTYVIVGIAGTILSLMTFSPLFGSDRVMILGATMGLLMWLSAAYLLWHAEQTAEKACGKPWSS